MMLPISSIPIPDDWTTDEAVAVFEFLKQITDTVWDKYAIALVTYYRDNTVSYCDDGDLSDEIPF